MCSIRVYTLFNVFERNIFDQHLIQCNFTIEMIYSICSVLSVLPLILIFYFNSKFFFFLKERYAAVVLANIYMCKVF